jgi:glycosyltransferase involved in cell wall biosynthesis
MGGELDQVLGGHEPHVIPTPVDTDAYRPASTAERAAARQALGLGEEVAVVYAGHLRASKRVDRLIDAVGRLHADGHATRLFVLGDSRPELDDCTVALRRQVTTAGLDEQVIFTGAVPDVRPYLHAADVFVLPSEREGLSNALLEALACGVPCVAPAAAGGDQILDATCGAVPASASPEALAAAIVEVTGPQHHALAAGARRIAASYSVDAVAGEYERLYARIGVSGNESARARRRRQ